MGTRKRKPSTHKERVAKITEENKAWLERETKPAPEEKQSSYKVNDRRARSHQTEKPAPKPVTASKPYYPLFEQPESSCHTEEERKKRQAQLEKLRAAAWCSSDADLTAFQRRNPHSSWLIACGVMLVACVLFAALMVGVSSNYPRNTSSKVSEPGLPPTLQSLPSAPPQTFEGEFERIVPSPTVTASMPSLPAKVVFNTWSNGHDWQKADFRTRMSYCERTATALNGHFHSNFTGEFLYGALDAFYNSSDSNILKQNMHEVVGMTTAVALNRVGQ